MDLKRQQDILTKKVKIINSNGIHWMLANPFGEALGFAQASKFIAKHVPPKNLTSYATIKADASFALELYPTTKFINTKGLCGLLEKRDKTLLEWIQTDFLPGRVGVVSNLTANGLSTQAESSIVAPTTIDEITKINVNGVWWMLAKPIASGLGYSDCDKAVRIHISKENQMEYAEIKSRVDEYANDDSSNTLKIIRLNSKFINEAGLFELIDKSNKTKTKCFQKWIYSGLLPTLRRDSQYHMDAAPLMVQHQMKAISSFLTPQKINKTPQQIQVANESSNVAPPTGCYDELINEIFKVNVNGVWWMLANPFARGLGYIYPPDAIRIIVSEENQMEYDVIKSRVKHGVMTSSSHE
jgi:prophage antirepressor-like protein